MPNPYHDEEGRFCSKGQMKAVVDELGTQVAAHRRDAELFDRWVELKAAYEAAANPADEDRLPSAAELRAVRRKVAARRAEETTAARAGLKFPTGLESASELRADVVDALSWGSAERDASSRLDAYLSAAWGQADNREELRGEILETMSWSETLAEGRMGPERAAALFSTYVAAESKVRARKSLPETKAEVDALAAAAAESGDGLGARFGNYTILQVHHDRQWGRTTYCHAIVRRDGSPDALYLPYARTEADQITYEGQPDGAFLVAGQTRRGRGYTYETYSPLS